VSHLAAFDTALARCPLIAILRGVRPAEVEAIGEALVGAGFALIEVPLNSPAPFDSIERLARQLGDHAIVGAGTVLAVEDAVRVQEVGGAMIVSPNADPAVIRASVSHGLVSIPGIFTVSEGLAALAAGANALKLFPAEGASPAALKAMRAVLPQAARVFPVGSISSENMAPWRAAGADGVGLGSALFRPGDSAGSVADRARQFVACWEAGNS
jgi:2-dehydro-3-deoxyphosphogalactonate aldolase